MSKKKLVIVMLVINACQFAIGALLLAGVGVPVPGWMGTGMRICLVLMMLSSLLTIVGLAATGLSQDRYYAETLKNLENLNARLREQKHDCMNQLQVVHGLMELGEYEEAHRYLKPVVREISRLNLALKTAQPAVNALMQAKMETAEKAGIAFYLEVQTDLKKIAIAPWDLCRILANLMDNAITALSDAGWSTEEESGQKRLTVRMRETAENYVFEVENNGPAIPEGNLNLIFLPGFTTKREEGHGQGLAIVARLTKEAGGSVRADSVPDDTSFFVTLPKAE